MCKGNCGKCKEVEFETTDVQVESLAERSGMIVDDGWISVNDRLPEDSEVVDCFSDGERWADCYHVNGVWYDRDVHMSIDLVTHWRPLPPPPVK